jgi:hypothetical protein
MDQLIFLLDVMLDVLLDVLFDAKLIVCLTVISHKLQRCSGSRCSLLGNAASSGPADEAKANRLWRHH